MQIHSRQKCLAETTVMLKTGYTELEHVPGTPWSEFPQHTHSGSHPYAIKLSQCNYFCIASNADIPKDAVYPYYTNGDFISLF